MKTFAAIATIAAITATIYFAACAALTPKPRIITKTDTVTVMKEVVAPLPNGDTTTICLGNGMPVTVRIDGADTLIGDARVKVKDVAPALAWAGSYTVALDTLTFEKRKYRKQGKPAIRLCDELKDVGRYNGVTVFADVTAPNNLPLILLPTTPGFFQAYAPEKPVKRR